MKKKLLPISLLCLVGMLLAGCNFGPNNSTQAPASSEQPAASSVVQDKSSEQTVASSAEVKSSSVAQQSSQGGQQQSSQGGQEQSSQGGEQSSQGGEQSSQGGQQSSQGGQSSETPQPVAVTGVALDKDAANVLLGETLQLTATVSPENADNQEVTWSSSDEDVATVSRTGLVTAEGIGQATITVKTRDGNKTATCVVTVIKEITSVSITNKAAFEGFIVDDMESINVEVDPADNVTALLAAGALKVTSTDETVAQVVGLTVNALKAGTTTIKVELFGKDDSFELTVGEAIPGVPYSVANALVKGFEEAPWNGNTGKTGAITTTCFELQGKILAVSENGATGFNAILDDGTGAVYLQVNRLKDDPIPVAAGDYAKVTCKFINYYGLLEGVSRKAATGDNASWIQAKDFEKIETPETPITPTLNEPEVMTGEQYNAYFDVCYTNAQKGDLNATYTLLKYVTIDAEYLKEFKDADKGGYKISDKYGLAPYGFEMDEPFEGQKSTLECFLIGANTGKGKSNAIVMKQTPLAPTSVVINEEAQTIVHGFDLQLSYSTEPAGSYARTAEWTSSDETAATVDENGLVHGVYVGEGTKSANIKVKLAEGVESGVVAISVFGEDVAATAVDLASTANVFVGGKIKLAPDTTPAMVSDVPVWVSDNEAIATVDQKGNVSGVAEGTANITVTYNANVSATCAVTVAWEKGVRESDPLTVDEAITITDALENKAKTDKAYFVKGYISEFLWDNFNDASKNNATFWLASSTASRGFEVYGAIAHKDLVKDNVKVGAEVLVGGLFTKYNTTLETSNGEATIYSATYEDHPATAIVINKEAVELKAGDSETLSLAPTPFYATNMKDVEWGSNNVAVATVANGKVSALRPGSATITAKLGDLVQQCVVTVTSGEQGDVRVIDFSAKTASHSSYGDTWKYGDATVSGGANNNGGWAFVKMGGKADTINGANYPGTFIKTDTAVAFPVASLSLKFVSQCYNQDSEKASVKVISYSDAELTTKVAETAAQEVPAIAKNGDPVTMTFAFAENQAAESFYKIEFSITNTTTYNGVVALEKVTFNSANAPEEIPQPVKAFHGLAKMASGAFVPIDLELTADSAILSVNGEAVTVASYAWDTKGILTLVTDEVYGTITAVLEDNVLIITNISGAARPMIDMSFAIQLSSNAKLIDCGAMTLDEMNAMFIRRYDREDGNGWQINKPSDGRISAVTKEDRAGLQCNGFLDGNGKGKVGFTLKADLETPIPGTVIKSVGCWIYNPGETSFKMKLFAYTSANRATNAQLNEFTIEPGWHFYQTGVVNGSSFKSTDSFYNFQFYYEHVGVNPVFDDLCIYM